MLPQKQKRKKVDEERVRSVWGLINAETGFDAEKYVGMVILAGANIWALTTFLRDAWGSTKEETR